MKDYGRGLESNDLKVDAEEREILLAYERGELVRVKNFDKVKKEAVLAARNTTAKKRNINLRVSEKTLKKLKAKAMEEGIPYQTLASSILHKYSSL